MADQNITPQTDREALEAYVEHLIKEKNSPHINEQNKKEIKSALLKDVTDAINQKFVSLLQDEEVKKLETLLKDGVANEVISKFFADKFPDQQKILTEVLIDFRKGYLSVQYPSKDDSLDLPAMPPAPAKASNGSNGTTSLPPAPLAPAPIDKRLN